MVKKDFLEILKKQGYELSFKKLGGGFSNYVQLVTAERDGKILQYVLKKYKSQEEMDSMLRGYDQISKAAKTPTIVYLDKGNKEVVYDYFKGMSIKKMIEAGDERVPEAMKTLAREMEKVHGSSEYYPKFKRGDSPDEKKLREHGAILHTRGGLEEDYLQQLQSLIQEYVPKRKTIIHGDAHLGNFHYVDGEIYILDTDNSKISDPNADIGKVIFALEDLEEEGSLSHRQSGELQKLFLYFYQGEDLKGVNLHRLRTPLIRSKKEDRVIPRVRRIIHENLEKIAEGAETIILLISSFLILYFASPNFTGDAIMNLSKGKSNIISLILIALSLIFLFLIIKRKEKTNSARM
jgi:aminoglycoside phosphotransferase (APT) family kinase protein